MQHKIAQPKAISFLSEKGRCFLDKARRCWQHLQLFKEKILVRMLPDKPVLQGPCSSSCPVLEAGDFISMFVLREGGKWLKFKAVVLSPLRAFYNYVS